MSFFQWRRFGFFDVVRDIDSGVLEQYFKGVKTTSCTSGRGHIIVGDDTGSIHLIDRRFQVETFKIFGFATHFVMQLKEFPFLATVGEDEPGVNPLIKIWNLEKRDNQGNPTCVHVTKAVVGNRPIPVTAFTIDEHLHLMVAGFADGSVILYRGDFSRDRYSKQKLIYQASGPITGLAIRSFQKVVTLFVSTSDAIVSCNISIKDKEQAVVLDSTGSAARCSVLADSKHEHHFMVARNDAIYCYTVDSLGPCYAFEGEKLLLHWFRGYLVVVTKNAKNETIVTVFDVHNKYIAFTGPVPETGHVVSEWGSLIVLTKDFKVHQLAEKDLQSKLDLLFKKNLYDVAIRVAKSQQYDADGLTEIFRQYGDHLYSKGSFSAAVEQYVKTIGRLEPSYVVKRFLDAQRIQQLTLYLQELHKQGMANEDHTTLLLNCYTKLRDTEQLDHFLNNKDKRGEFDVETAIRVCRQSGYFSQALQLAQDCQKHDWHLKILLEDMHDYRQAFEYITKLPIDQVEENMKEHAGILLEKLPEQTTQFITELCTKGINGEGRVCNAEDFLLSFINHSEQMIPFLEKVIQAVPSSSSSLYFALLEQYLEHWSKSPKDSSSVELEKKILQLLTHPSVLSSSDRALFLCQANAFKVGVLVVHEKTKMYAEILQNCAAAGDFDGVITTCRRFGQQDPSLWVQALSVAVEDFRTPANCLSEILTAIDKNRLLPSLKVIDLVSRSPTATLGIVRDYLIRVLQNSQSSISEDKRLIDQYKQETSSVRNKIEDIQNAALVFQGSKCSICTQPLELPSVHFLCLHSFHQYCFESFADNDMECPSCQAENRKIVDIVRSQEQSKDLHESFYRQLEKAEDPFTVLADYFGRGVFNTLPSWETSANVPKKKTEAATFSAAETGPVSGPGAEAKLRKSEGKSTTTSLTGMVGEGRMRAEEIASSQVTGSSEGRLRAAETSRSTAVVSPPSEARHRLNEGTRTSYPMARKVDIPVKSPPVTLATSFPGKASLETRSSFPRPASSAQLRTTESRPQVNQVNPFEDEYDEKNNPFTEEEETLETVKNGGGNPFGEDEDYNDELNPFNS